MENKEKKLLLQISNLKQYFPLKAKGLYVKANDGITLDIYEGETLGLVGESGCGKSTLGRTLLQLYRQTDGRTMYYGRSLEELAPKYVGKTYKTLEKRIKQQKQLRKNCWKKLQTTPECWKKCLKRKKPQQKTTMLLMTRQTLNSSFQILKSSLNPPI